MTTPYRTSVRRISIARMISLAGSEAAFIALIAALYTRTHSTTWVSGRLARRRSACAGSWRRLRARSAIASTAGT
jgi:hypothetical protein